MSQVGPVWDEFKSEAMKKVREKVEQVAETTALVLITGETGVGKEIVAQKIHEGSLRKDKPFKAVNCGAFYQDLLQSELFGHEKGAFTGAHKMKRGIFEQANTGTLFLDEVGEMSPEAQVKFLRVLDKQEFTRLGGEKDIKVDVRIVAATNVDLGTAVKEGKLRQDLYYRLKNFPIHIPPLRDRREDIPIFLNQFIAEFNAMHKKKVSLSDKAKNYLEKEAKWGGNIRQLRNCVEAAVLLAKLDEQIEHSVFEDAIASDMSMTQGAQNSDVSTSGNSNRDGTGDILETDETDGNSDVLYLTEADMEIAEKIDKWLDNHGFTSEAMKEQYEKNESRAKNGLEKRSQLLATLTFVALEKIAPSKLRSTLDYQTPEGSIDKTWTETQFRDFIKQIIIPISDSKIGGVNQDEDPHLYDVVNTYVNNPNPEKKTGPLKISSFYKIFIEEVKEQPESKSSDVTTPGLL